MSGPHSKRLQSVVTKSKVTPITQTSLTLSIDPNLVRHFAGVVFYLDSSGEEDDLPTSGTATITVQTVVQPGGFQDVESNVLDVASLNQVDWSSNTERVRVQLSSITGFATHYRLIVSSNIA